MGSADLAAWKAAINQLDPAPKTRHIDPADLAALETPTTLADHLSRYYRVRAHLTVVGDEIRRIHDGNSDRLAISLPPQIGKPVYAGTMVLMGDGSRKRIDHIEVGDGVITHRGHPRSVSAVHHQGVLPVLKIATLSGRETIAAYDHPFLTPTGWVQAQHLSVGDLLALVPNAQTMPTSTLSAEEARLLGYFVGDGSTSGKGMQFAAGITTASPAVFQEISRCADELGFTVNRSKAAHRQNKASQYHISGGVRPWLRHHGLAGKTSLTKRVPQAVFNAGPEIIAEFLGGYWDCDGTVSWRGMGRKGVPRPDILVELYSSARALLMDVQHLLLRLGIRSAVRDKPITYKGEPYMGYRLSIISQDDVAKFCQKVRLVQELRSARIMEFEPKRTAFDPALIGDPIVSIEKAGDEECLCLTVEEDHTFTADDIVVHNTLTAVVWGAFWWLCLNPTVQIIIVSYNDQRAVERGHAIRKLVEEYGARFGLYLDPSSRAKHSWSTTTGGAVRSLGIGSGIAGVPGDVVWIDDPHKSWEEAESPVMRQKVHDAYAADISTRLAPFAPVILIQTRWHEDDLAGRRIREEGDSVDGGRWRVVSMPALCTNPQRDPLHRSMGEPLPHPKIREGDRVACLRHWEDKRASNPPRVWFALYQGDPKPAEGALLAWTLLHERRCYEHGKTGCAQPKRIGVAIDPSGGGRDTAGIIGGYLGEDDRLHFTDDRSGVMPSDLWGRKACELAADIDADCFVIETNYGGDQATLVLRTSWNALRRENPTRFSVFCPRVIPVHAKRGKLLRAEPIAQQWKEDRIRTAQYLPDVEAEWATWQADGKHQSPGRIDASVYLAYEFLPIPASGETQIADYTRGQIDLTRNLSPGDIGLIR